MSPTTFSLASGLLLGVALAACSQIDPYTRQGVWHPVGANAANLTAMVADPNDLNVGRGSATAPGDLAGVAALRLRTGTTRRLPASAISKIQNADNGTDPADAAPAVPAAPAAAAGTP
jgi:hypothetical protein